MKIQCSKCQSKYNIADEKIPDAGARTKCPKCQNVISVMKPKPEPPALSSEDLTADIGNESDKSDSKDEIKSKTKLCPYCAEEIKAEAIKCKHCGSNLSKKASNAPVTGSELTEKVVNTYTAGSELTKKVFNRHMGGPEELTGTLMLICPLVAAFLLWILPDHSKIYIVALCIIATAILAAIEATRLQFGTNTGGKKETGPIGYFVALILLWIVAFPAFFYKRAKRGRKNLTAASVIVAIVFMISTTGIGGSFSGIFSPEIAMVKNGELTKYPEFTIGEAVESFMGNPEWDVSQAVDGNFYVNVRGRITYGQKESVAALQFKVDKTRETFEINALEINGEPQNVFVIMSLLDKMYASAENPKPTVWNPFAYFSWYKKEANCASIESHAQATMAAVADYFSDPYNDQIPTTEQLKSKGGYDEQYPTAIGGSIDDDIMITVFDENNICRKGRSYVAGMGSGGRWLK